MVKNDNLLSNDELKLQETNRALKKIANKEKRKKYGALMFVWVMLIIMYLPIMYLILYSFTYSDIIGQWTGFSLDGYVAIFNPTDYPDAREIWISTWNTVWVALVASSLSTILGTFGAIGMHHLGKKLKTTFNLATQIPIVNAEIVMAISICMLFLSLGLSMSAFTLIIGHMVLTIPFVVINVQPKLEQMDQSLYEAAMDLGASRMGALFKVVIPDIVPGILSGFMISLTLSLDDYVITTFTKSSEGEDFNTISTYIQGTLGKKGIPPVEIRPYTTIVFVVIVAAMVGYTIVSYRKGKLKSN